MAAPAPQIECSVCCETRAFQNIQHDIDGELVCDDCISTSIIPEFHAALKYESRFPVRWGATILQAADFKAELGQDFVQRFQKRQEEYAVIPSDRIYCKHKMVAPLQEQAGMIATNVLALSSEGIAFWENHHVGIAECGAMVAPRSVAAGYLQCYHCQGTTCATCENPVEPGCQYHTCTPRKASTDNSTNRFQGMIRGKHYQLCPNPACGLPAELREACNHMTCPVPACCTSYCFVCGREAEGDSDHWTFGKPCQRYNQPGATDAVFDEEESERDQFLTLISQSEEPLRREAIPLAGLIEDDSDEPAEDGWEILFRQHNAQPLLEAPKAGQTWFDISEQMKVNASKYFQAVMQEIIDGTSDARRGMMTLNIGGLLYGILCVMMVDSVRLAGRLANTSDFAARDLEDGSMPSSEQIHHSYDMVLLWLDRQVHDMEAIVERLPERQVPESMPLLAEALRFVRIESNVFRHAVLDRMRVLESKMKE